METNSKYKAFYLIYRGWIILYVMPSLIVFVAITIALLAHSSLIVQKNWRDGLFLAGLSVWPVVTFFGYRIASSRTLIHFLKAQFSRKNLRISIYYMGIFLILQIGLFYFRSRFNVWLHWLTILLVPPVLFSFSSPFILKRHVRDQEIRSSRFVWNVLRRLMLGGLTGVLGGIVLLYVGLWPQLTLVAHSDIRTLIFDVHPLSDAIRVLLKAHGFLFAGTQFFYGIFSGIFLTLLLPGWAFWRVLEEEAISNQDPLR